MLDTKRQRCKTFLVGWIGNSVLFWVMLRATRQVSGDATRICTVLRLMAGVTAGKP